jgi:hypothetical protein
VKSSLGELVLAKYYIDWDTHRNPFYHSADLCSLIGKKVAIHGLYGAKTLQGILIKIYEDPDRHGRDSYDGAFSFVLEVSPNNQVYISYGTIEMIETIE